MAETGHSEGRSAGGKRSSREIARLVLAAAALVVLVAFVVDNSNTVKVGFVLFSTDISLIWALLIAAFLGALVDRLVMFVGRRRKRDAA